MLGMSNIYNVLILKIWHVCHTIINFMSNILLFWGEGISPHGDFRGENILLNMILRVGYKTDYIVFPFGLQIFFFLYQNTYTVYK